MKTPRPQKRFNWMIILVIFLVEAVCLPNGFAANEDIIESQNALLGKRNELLQIAVDRNQRNVSLNAFYAEVKKNPSIDSLRNLISQLEQIKNQRLNSALSPLMARFQFTEYDMHGREMIPGKIHISRALEEFKDRYISAVEALSDKNNQDSEVANTALGPSATALVSMLQMQIALEAGKAENQKRKKQYCETLPQNVRTVTSKAKWDAYKAIEKGNLWFADLAQKKITVTRVAISRGQEICGNSFQSSLSILAEASGYVEKAMKAFPRAKIEKDICGALPQGVNCTRLLLNPYFLAYVSQVPRSSLRNLSLYQVSLPLIATNLNSNLNSQFREICDGPVCIREGGDGGAGSPGGGSGGKGGGIGGGGTRGGGVGSGTGMGPGRGGGIDNYGGGGRSGGIGSGNNGSVEPEETPEQRAYRELVGRARIELTDRFNELSNAIASGQDIRGVGSDIVDAVNTSLQQIEKVSDFAEDLRNSIEVQSGDISGLASAFMPNTPTPYKSNKASEYAKIEAKLSGIETPQGNDARKAVKEVLTAADTAQANGDSNSAVFYKGIAQAVVDIGLSITPGVSIGKDAYEALTGKSLVTGEPLDGFSRGMAILGVVTVGGTDGAGALVKYGIRGAEKLIHIIDEERQIVKIGRILKKTGDFEKAVVKQAIELVEKYGVKARGIFPGKSGKFVIIGRDMNKVREAKSALGKGAEVMIFDGDSVISEVAKNEWNELVERYAKQGKMIPSEIVKTTKMYQENKSWLEKAISEGHTVIDMGNPAKTSSPFYEMEIKLLEGMSSVLL